MILHIDWHELSLKITSFQPDYYATVESEMHLSVRHTPARADAFAEHPCAHPWPELLRRTRGRPIYRAKRWLNGESVMQMTADLLAQRDPAGEVLQWLTLIAEMATAKS